MPDKIFDVAIVGAGVSGLASALLLSEAGKDICILEAHHSCGGRIRSVFDKNKESYVADLGPTWVWPGYQPVIQEWIKKLNLKTFEQYNDGYTILDYGIDTQPEVRLIPGQHGSRRIIGGSQALIDTMLERLATDRIMTNTQVNQISFLNNEVKIQTHNTDHPEIHARNLIIALPPRIALHTINWKNELSTELKQVLNITPTWMAPHAKVAIIYEDAFWRDQNLSGRIISHAGPIVESHDHCSADNSIAALWGFIGWPHELRSQIGLRKLKSEILQQLKRCFGSNSPAPVSITIEDWSQNPLITSPDDLSTKMGHPDIVPSCLRQGYNGNKVWFTGAETAEKSPGLIEGAFVSANRVTRQILESSN